MATVEALLHTEAVDHEPVPPVCEEEGVPAASRAEAWRKLLLHGTGQASVCPRVRLSVFVVCVVCVRVCACVRVFVHVSVCALWVCACVW